MEGHLADKPGLPVRLKLPLLEDLRVLCGALYLCYLFGLDYIATVPPTVTLVADGFGKMNVGAIFGRVFFSHQFDAALASYFDGVACSLGDCTTAILAALVASPMSWASLWSR